VDQRHRAIAPIAVLQRGAQEVGQDLGSQVLRVGDAGPSQSLKQFDDRRGEGRVVRQPVSDKGKRIADVSDAAASGSQGCGQAVEVICCAESA